mmetsp:Transcript_14051/g.21072  ORF Transcript_14051/g.21072 Transcript_14051/m.21072 type:complete len:221 (+) Transcript_14051:1318-1980(+)
MLLKAKILVKEIQEGHSSFLETPTQEMMTYKLEWLALVLDVPMLNFLAYMQGSLQPMIGSESRFARIAIILRVNMTVHQARPHQHLPQLQAVAQIAVVIDQMKVAGVIQLVTLMETAVKMSVINVMRFVMAPPHQHLPRLQTVAQIAVMVNQIKVAGVIQFVTLMETAAKMPAINVIRVVLSLTKAKECRISYSLETSARPLNALTEVYQYDNNSCLARS